MRTLSGAVLVLVMALGTGGIGCSDGNSGGSDGNSGGSDGNSGGSDVPPGPPITVPTSLDPGDEYRLVFVTSEERHGASSSISAYNNFVTGVAETQPKLTSLGTTWRAIASTATVDARDNTGTNPLVDGVGVPIFLLNDTLLANDNLDLWDGSILVPIEIDEGGSAIQRSFVWTGTHSSGVSRGATALGGGGAGGTDSDVGIGTSAVTHGGWVAGADWPSFLPQPVYALSEVLVVAP